MIPWIRDAKDDDVTVSSRIRLARNLKDEVFPGIMDENTGDKVFDRAKGIVSSTGDYKYVKMEDTTPVERHAMVERHIISPELERSRIGGIAKTENESTVIMINEEDHFRMQTITPGFEIEDAYVRMSEIHEPIKDNFAFDSQFGYLTACPTNVGTGLRASTMLHIPAIMMTGQLQNVTNIISKMGMTLRGIYGEGSNALGNMVQLSNQVTLGLSEREIVDKLKAIAANVIENERNARKLLFEKNKSYTEDKIMRSLGILKYATRLSSKETISMLSDVKMGVALGIIKGIKHSEIHSLIMESGPCQLQMEMDKELNENERDEIRAEMIKKAFEKIV